MPPFIGLVRQGEGERLNHALFPGCQYLLAEER